MPTYTGTGAPAWPAAAFSLGAAKKVLSPNAAGNYQFVAVIMNGANPSSASPLGGSDSAAAMASTPATFNSRKILKTAWNPASSPAELELGIQFGSGFTVPNPVGGDPITFMANGTQNLHRGHLCRTPTTARS